MIRPPKHCKKRPRRSDGAVVHPYCGRTCANLAKGQGPTNRNTPVPTSPVRLTNPFIATSPSNVPANPRNSVVSMNPRGSIVSTNPRDSIISMNSTIKQKNRSSVYRKSFSVPTCKTPGCSSPVYVDKSGVASDYCTRTHWKYVSQLYLVSEAGTKKCPGGDTMVVSLVARPQRTV